MSSYIDSQNIFPKRLGIMNGNILIIEYYHFVQDKFKKHSIPFNPHAELKLIISAIYQHPKHIVYLKKVDPKHLQSVLEANIKHPNINNTSTYQIKQHKYEQQVRNITEQASEKHIVKINNLVQQKKQVKEQKHIQRNIEKKQEVQDYYDQQFEDFQISQSVQTPNTISISNISMPMSESSSKNSQSLSSKADKLKKKKSQKIAVQAIQQIDEDFEFIDETDKKKKKKQKKQKKEKKEKSKNKEKKQKKKGKQANDNENKTIEEEFQFI